MKKRGNTNEVELSNVKSRPFTVKGRKAMDAELVHEAVKKIDEYIKDNGELPAGLDGKFISWLREADKACQSGESITKFKRTTVSRTFSDYSILKGVTK